MKLTLFLTVFTTRARGRQVLFTALFLLSAAASGAPLFVVGNQLYTPCAVTTASGQEDDAVCAVDTGAGSSILWRSDVTTSLKAKPGQNPQASYQIIDLAANTAKLSASELDLGSPDVALFSPGSQFDDNGSLGIDVLGQGVMSFDFSGLTVSQLLALPPTLKAYPFSRDRNRRVVIQATISKAPVNLMVDTRAGNGNSDGIINQNFQSQHLSYFRFVKNVTVGNYLGQTFTAPVYELLMPISIGSIQIPAGFTFISVGFDNGPFGAGLGPDLDIVAGLPVLASFKWYFDFTSNQWAAE